MQVDYENKLFDNPVIVSDTKLSWIIKTSDGTVGCEGFSIAEASWSDDDKLMRADPIKVWNDLIGEDDVGVE